MTKLPITTKLSQPNEYMTREAAAKRLRRSLRTVDRYIEQGILTKCEEKIDGRRQASTLVLAADVARRLAPQAQLIRPKGREVAVSNDAGPGALLRVLQSAVQTHHRRPWADLREAAEYSGLPAAYLKRLCEARAIGRDLNEGTRAPGHRWIIRLKDLDELAGVGGLNQDHQSHLNAA